MYCEKLIHIDVPKDGVTLKPKGEGKCFEFNVDECNHRRFRLLTVGETEMFYQWKDEPDYPQQYRSITDALSDFTLRAQYSLNMSLDTPKKYSVRVYKKCMWPPVLSYITIPYVGEEWNVGFYANVKNLKLAENGFITMELDIFTATDGVDRRSPKQNVQKYCIPITDTDGEWIKLEKSIIIPKNTTFIGMWFDGREYSGDVYIERPFLKNKTEYNVIPDFSVPVQGRGKFEWTAQNLSHKEWVQTEIYLNGKLFYKGDIFEHSHRYSEWEIPVPNEHLNVGKNVLEIKNVSDYHDPLPYTVYGLDLIETPCHALEVVSVPEIAYVGKNANVLVNVHLYDDYSDYRNEDAPENCAVFAERHSGGIKPLRVRVNFDSERFSGKTEYVFSENGLYVISLKCLMPARDACIEINDEAFKVKAIIDKTCDGIITGSGDEIYIPQRRDYFEEFLCWYFSNNVGNLLTVRPTYRWSSTRVRNDGLWEDFKRLMIDTETRYSHMLDGRELPGCNTNPSAEQLLSPFFLGRQQHERDGALVYWGVSPSSSPTGAQTEDMFIRMSDEEPENVQGADHSAINCFYGENGINGNRDLTVPNDYKAGAEYFVKRAAELRERDGAVRHTGPSYHFDRFTKAGYKFVGAETMYSSLEPHLAICRGVAAKYGCKIGVHHALQWCNSPLDTPENVRRFRLALYLSYMLGADEINTEEGFWHMEECYVGFSRFSDACKNHLEQQRDFYRYIRLHSRTGKLKCGLAFVQGKYDAFCGFVKYQPWGKAGVRYGEGEESWDLLKVIYPLSKPGENIYRHPCTADRPEGYFTGTPFGQADIIPYDAEKEAVCGYKTVVFLGYNCADKTELDKLYEYAENGGRVILTQAHLTDTTDMAEILGGRLEYNTVSKMHFTEGKPEFAEKTVNGVKIKAAQNIKKFDKILLSSDDGIPLAGVYKAGKGEIVYFAVNAYPSNAAVRHAYEEAIKASAVEYINGDDIKVTCGNDVQYAKYVCDDGKVFLYLTAVDWYNEPTRVRTVKTEYSGHEYEISFKFGVMLKLIVNDGLIAYCENEDCEITDLTRRSITVNGLTPQKVYVLNGGKTEEHYLRFDDAPTQIITLLSEE